MARYRYYCGHCGTRIYPGFTSPVRCTECGAQVELGTVIGETIIVLALFFFWVFQHVLPLTWAAVLGLMAAVALPLGIRYALRRSRGQDTGEVRMPRAMEQLVRQAQEAKAQAARSVRVEQLVFADPPHRGSPDAASVAQVLGWPIPEASRVLSSTLPVPVAAVDGQGGTRLAEALRDLRASCLAVPLSELCAMPVPLAVRELAFERDALTYEAADGSGGRVRFSEVKVAVVGADRKRDERKSAKEATLQAEARSKRRQADQWWTTTRGQIGLTQDAYRLEKEARESGGEVTETFEPWLQLVYSTDEGLRRLVFRRDALRYEGLGADRQPSATANFAKLVQRVESAGVAVDRRVQNGRPQPPTIRREPLQRICPSDFDALGILGDGNELFVALLTWKTSRVEGRR